MAGTHRGQARSLIETLAQEPYRFDVRQASRILDARQRLQDGPPVVFRSSLSLSFPVADIQAVTIPQDGRAPVVTVSFLGLGGAGGPLPAPYTEHLNAAVRRGETAARDFLDIFNHRLVVAAMALARTFQPALQSEPPQRSSLAQQCDALLGLLTPGDKHRVPELAPALLPLTGLLNRQPVSAHAIERAVTAHFGMPAVVRPFRGDWLRIPADQRTRIGRRGHDNILGVTAMLGGRVWDQSAGIGLDIGPLPFARAAGFLPGADRANRAHRELRALIDFLVEGSIPVAARVHVDPATIPAARLPVRGTRLGTARLAAQRLAAPRAPTMRLGLTSWLTRGGTADTPVVAFALAARR